MSKTTHNLQVKTQNACEAIQSHHQLIVIGVNRWERRVIAKRQRDARYKVKK